MTLKQISISGLLFLIMGSLLITSCSSVDDNDVNTNTPVAIQLTSKLDVLSRASLQDTQIENGQEVGLFVNKASSLADDLYANEKLRADGAGNFSYSTSMFYPISNENVDFYAYHPYEIGALLNSVINFSVKADQSVKVNHLSSDLLYAENLNVAKTTSAVPMKFYHKLAKLNFTIKEGDGMDLAGMTSVEVLNLLPSITMNLAGGELSTVNGDITSIVAYGTRGTTGSESEVTGISAIVVPQIAASSTRLFKITLNGGTANELSYYYTPTADVTFEGGKKYNFILTLNHAGITVTSSIEDWIDSGGTIEGEGTLD